MDNIERDDFLDGKRDPWLCCMLCETYWDTPDSDGIVDRPVVTPCYHIFGVCALSSAWALIPLTQMQTIVEVAQSVAGLLFIGAVGTQLSYNKSTYLTRMELNGLH